MLFELMKSSNSARGVTNSKGLAGGAGGPPGSQMPMVWRPATQMPTNDLPETLPSRSVPMTVSQKSLGQLDLEISSDAQVCREKRRLHVEGWTLVRNLDTSFFGAQRE